MSESGSAEAPSPDLLDMLHNSDSEFEELSGPRLPYDPRYPDRAFMKLCFSIWKSWNALLVCGRRKKVSWNSLP